MKKFLAVIVLGLGLLTIASLLFPQEESEESEDDTAYGDPDGKTSQSDVASFVD